MLPAKKKQNLGILVAAVGIVLLCVSYYLSDQAEDGRETISGGHIKIDSDTGAAHIKIDTEKEGGAYKTWGHILQLGGIIGIVAGGSLWLFGRFDKK